MRKQYENMQMNDGGAIVDLFSRYKCVSYQSDKAIWWEYHWIVKGWELLRTLAIKYDHIVMAIEYSKNLSKMKL